MRIAREVSEASEAQLAGLYSDLLAFWASGLLPHFRVEQECLLARLVRSVGVGHETIQRTQDDHLSLESLVVTMRETSDLGTRRDALARFGASLRDHIRWEEAVLFEVTQQTLTGAEMDALGTDISEQLPEVVPSPAAEST